MSKTSVAKFDIGQVTRHRVHAFRGVVFDVNPEYADGTPSYDRVLLIEGRQRQDQPFYYLFAENGQAPYIAYVPEQNLLADTSDEPVVHPEVDGTFERDGMAAFDRAGRC